MKFLTFDWRTYTVVFALYSVNYVTSPDSGYYMFWNHLFLLHFLYHDFAFCSIRQQNYRKFSDSVFSFQTCQLLTFGHTIQPFYVESQLQSQKAFFLGNLSHICHYLTWNSFQMFLHCEQSLLIVNQNSTVIFFMRSLNFVTFISKHTYSSV